MSHELAAKDDRESIDVTGSLRHMLSHVTEAEFMQMVRPLVHLLPMDIIQFLLLNSTSEEIVELLGRVKDPEFLNRIAIETEDEVVGTVCAQRDELTLDSLNCLMDKFTTPNHLVLYSKHIRADLSFLHRIKEYVEKNRKTDDSLVSPFPQEYAIFENIAAHHAADAALLGELEDYVTAMISALSVADKSLNEAKLAYEESIRGAFSYRVWEDTDVKKELTERYEVAVKRCKLYFDTLLAVCGNANTEISRLHLLFEKYHDKSVHNIHRYIPGIAMQFMGATHANSVGYRILMNPSIDKEFRKKHINSMLDENKGVYESGGSGEEYLLRVANADNAIAVQVLHNAWCKVEDAKDRLWNFNHAALREYAAAIGKNENAPSDVVDDVIRRVCDTHPYYEYLRSIVCHPNISSAGVLRLSQCLVSIEERDRHYMDYCVRRVLIPLCNSTVMTEESGKILYTLTYGMAARGLEALCCLADNTKVTGLDDEFGGHSFWVVRRNYASRSDSLEWLEKLRYDTHRDVCVAARRRYVYLTRQSLLLGDFEKNLLGTK